MTDVAILGLGRMGHAMAHRLDDAGHNVVLWNRTTQKAEQLASDLNRGIVAQSPAQAVADADVVLSILADGPATEHVLLDNELLAATRPDQVVVDMGTSGRGTAQRLSRAFDGTPASFLDAPVSGSVATVQAGQLLIMASGSDDAIDRVAPVMGAFAKQVVRLGEAGNGQVMKLAVNLVVHGLNAIVSESLAMAETAGIGREQAYDVLEGSVVAAPFVTYKREAFLDEDAPVAFTIALVDKDLSLIREHARGLAVPVVVTDAVAEVVRQASSRGLGDRDMASLRAAIVQQVTDGPA